MLQYIVTETSMTVLIDGVPQVIPNTHRNFEAIEQAVIAGGPIEKIKDLIDTGKEIREFVSLDPQGFVTVKAGEVFYKDEVVNSALSRRILALKDKGFNITPFILFMENLYNNPSYRAVNELYGFLEACNLPITEDGCFLAYKKIKDDYTDCYTGTIDNSIGAVGAVVEMPRYKVNEDSEQTCSYGLHVASYSYMAHCPGQRIVICKVNPADVVAVPKDYNNSKMRVCKYEVINEVKLEDEQIADNAISNEEAYHKDLQEDKGNEPEFYEGSCPECGAENRWHEEEQYCEKCDYTNDEWIEWNEGSNVEISDVLPNTTQDVIDYNTDPYGMVKIIMMTKLLKQKPM